MRQPQVNRISRAEKRAAALLRAVAGSLPVRTCRQRRLADRLGRIAAVLEGR